mmetsp:Transcript_73915/g.228379  ORF Transcript_73915/g.228379 Transcript_73915/m.228379 type:complete len:254 (+) Transcript_73915:65-826(+)|eukprot:CAMPEP_0204514234 /NCGR_PEP_ID=MMETSP0661-20131031/1950_1 /ASSEMBLY_ACC=CAM_ASM_000606 /TAXON_ID=109239 /ORGANISM="Alexandrium margalefi, Strain AMGDE01CS-322" /LENGTH=253 /DNA_ID=CAMNT_0051519471 /DNA_START=65 /DNA_END=826 /DNA_ORIENTATION=-
MSGELSLRVHPPEGGALITMGVSKLCTGEALKEKLRYIAKAQPQDQVVHFQNGGESASAVELVDESTLEVQGVESGALITIDRVKAAPESASQDSLYKHGKLSYYHTYREDPRFTSDMSVQGGGEPVKLDGSGTIADAVRIDKYTWADDAKNVKIFVEAEAEPRAVKSAGDGKGGKVDAVFQENGFALKITDEGRKFVLEVPKLYSAINPKECKVRVSDGKRITVTLRKADTTHSWFTLLEASQASILNNARG